MRKVLRQRTTNLRRWTGICFVIIIAVGWSGIVLFTGSMDLSLIDRTSFIHMQQNGLIGATPSVLYSAFLAGPFFLGFWLRDFDCGSLFAIGLQVFIVILCLAYVCYWLYKRGLPLWASFFAATLVAFALPLAQAALQPDRKVLVTLCLLLLLLKMIDSMRNNFYGLRIGRTVYAVLVLLALLIFLDPLFLVVAVPTVLIISIVPTRNKIGVFGRAFIMLMVCSLLLFLMFPYLGLQVSPHAVLIGLLSHEAGMWISVAPVIIVGALVWFILGKSIRYTTPLVPFVVLYLIIVFNFSWDQASWYAGILDCSLLLSLPVLILLPFMYEYSESKAEMRKRLLEARKSIPEAERIRRSFEACDRLTEMIKRFDPQEGYVALYSAFGSELSLNPLQAKLGALGYRLAYPVRISDSEIEFVTTLGVTDEELLGLVVEKDLFAAFSKPQSIDLPQIDPKEIALMLLPCVGMDKDNNRLGYGKGCYDRYLNRLRSKTPLWVVGFSEQLVDSVPVERQDKAADDRVVA